jgi:YVTN family beta-propeller protein
VDNAKGKFAYVTVGEENAVKVYRRSDKPELVAKIPTGDLPHGIWGSADGSRVYVGLENQDAVSAIDTLENKVLATIPIGQQPQALVYVPNAVPDGEGAANLTPLGESGRAAHLTLKAPDGGRGHATVSVNSLGQVDLLEAGISGLKPNNPYTLWLVASRKKPYGDKQALAKFKTNQSGAQVVQVIGPLRRTVTENGGDSDSWPTRFLLVTPADGDTADLIQVDSSPNQ